MLELRHNTEQTIRVGVLRNKNNRAPITGALLSWYYWKYLVKADGVILNIISRIWTSIANCDGVYYLTLLASDVNVLGHLTILINDTALLDPIFIQAMVINQNSYDAKYGTKLLVVTKADKF